MKLNTIFKNLLLLGLIVLSLPMISQEKEPSPFDFGRMWTFENPPKEWFQEAYDFNAEDEWFDYVRKSSLRFASWCSASFVSADGLIMTNHHCSRDEGIKVQEGTENFDVNGFYAKSLADERNIEGLYVEQMIMAIDITDDVNAAMKTASGDNEGEKKAKVLADMEAKYTAMPGWEGLRLQMVGFHKGIKYSVYGYKRYNDIRLVCMPENSIGFYGGDPDNFTYPRYNLDFTFWRAYDENGQPVNTSANFLKFNPAGAVEGEPVFVVGNPGSTERYRTSAQLAYDRDYRFNQTLEFLDNRIELLRENYDSIKNDPSMERDAQELLGTITNLANGQKAYGGILKGLQDPALFGRKVAMENIIKSKSTGMRYWDDLSNLYKGLSSSAWAINNMGQSPLRGSVLSILHELNDLEDLIKSKSTDEEIDAKKMSIKRLAASLNDEKEQKLFKVLLNEIKMFAPKENKVVSNLMGRLSGDALGNNILSNTIFKDADKLEKLFKKNKKITKSQDPLMLASRALIPEYKGAVTQYRSSTPERKILEEKIVNQVFHVYGDALPPDATFTLRISDGVVKSYDYNGTKAPVKTTFFGLYDRHYSHGEVYPWDLPEKWLNPSMELLKSPMDFVSTNDIIGGNSGSPVINKNREAVGLAFDGNIESLPGNFIFDEEANRTVSVHAGGIFAALKYVYKADRLVEELSRKRD